MQMSRVATRVVVTLIVFSFSTITNAFASSIMVENYDDSEILHYPIALVQGRVSEIEQGVVVIENLSSNAETRIARAPILRGRFKTLIELRPGRNDLILAAGANVRPFTLIYRASSNPHFVRVVWFRGADETENDDHSHGGDVELKLRVAARLWQTATGERLYAGGYGRRSFRLETNDNGEALVWKLRGRKRADEYISLSPTERFNAIYRETRESELGDRNACYFILVSLGAGGNASFDSDETRIALGTNEVAMLDASRVVSWPERLDQVEEFLLDASRVSEEYARDSAFRLTKWSLVSSTLGAGLHELGHAFGLDHSTEPSDFMSRGFDRFNRIFTVYEPSSALGETRFFDDDEVASWGRTSALRLIRSKWIE